MKRKNIKARKSTNYTMNLKTEFAFDRIFNNLEELKLELRSYVLCYNNKRIHSSLNYMTPVEYRLANMTE